MHSLNLYVHIHTYAQSLELYIYASREKEMSRNIIRLTRFIRINIKKPNAFKVNSFVRPISAFSSLLKNENKSFFSIQETSAVNPTIAANQEKQQLTYEQLSNQTLESLAEQFDELGDQQELDPKIYDVAFSNGVLTVKFGPKIGKHLSFLFKKKKNILGILN